MASLTSREVGWVFNQAALVISRAGANTVSEILCFRKPSILIPIPWSYQNEQKENALRIEEIKGGKTLDQETVTPEQMVATIQEIVENRDFYLKNLRQAKVKDGKGKFLKEVERIMAS